MRLHRGWFRYLSAGVLLCLLTFNKLYACSRSISEVKVPTSFRISVLNDKEPVAGIQVAVYDTQSLDSNSPAVLKSLTDNDGQVEIKNLREGRYIVQTEGPGQGDAVYASVSDQYKKTDAGFSLQWPFSWQGVLKLRTIAGELASNNPLIPFETVHLELWTAGSNAPLAREEVGGDGKFHFDQTTPGIYILRIRGEQKGVREGWQVEGDIAIELSSSSEASASLPLRLAMTSCGIEYSSCPLRNDTPIVSAARRFQVLYGPGITGEHPWINDAVFKLLNDGGTAIAEGRTDSQGMGSLPPNFVGKANLIVASSGLATMQQMLDLLPADEAASVLVVRLAGMSSHSCSTTTLETHATAQ